MSSMLRVGDIVCNPQMPDWGHGTVRSVSEKKISVHFPNLNVTKQFVRELSPIKLVTSSESDAIKQLLESIGSELESQNLKPFDRLGWLPGCLLESKMKQFQSFVNNTNIQGWSFGPTHDAAAESTVDSLWRRAHDLDIRLFVSRDESLIPSYSSIEEMNASHKGNPFHTFVYAFHNLPVPEIVEFAHVNDNGDQEWREVKRQIVAAHSIWAFEILIARSDYLAGKFIVPVKDLKILHQLWNTLPAGTFDLSVEDAITKVGFTVGWD